jgi:ParB family chromosome partitioning protein
MTSTSLVLPEPGPGLDVEALEARVGDLLAAIERIDDIGYADELRARAAAIEEYLARTGADPAPAWTIARNLEARIGYLLGPPESTNGRPLHRDVKVIHHSLRKQFRLLDKYRLVWEANPGPRRRVLGAIDAVRRRGVENVMSSTGFECYTPAGYIEAARDVLGGIDLDPASSKEANETVGAAEFYDQETDGLAHDWHGRVWLNPPYGRHLTSQFVTKLVGEFDAGRVVAAITVLNAYGFDASWFRPLFGHVLCFTDHRIQFYGGGPTFGSLFAYLGPEPLAFAQTFAQFGPIVRRWWP